MPILEAQGTRLGIRRCGAFTGKEAEELIFALHRLLADVRRCEEVESPYDPSRAKRILRKATETEVAKIK